MTETLAEQLPRHAELIRASGILGRSELLLRLFNFLVRCSAAAHTPKELEIAHEVFGKRADFDVGQDAMVRVYMLKLRRKLDDYYAGAGAAQPQRLVLPKGEYRLLLRDQQEVLALPLEREEPSPAEQAEAEEELESLVASTAGERARHGGQPWWRISLITLLGALLVAAPVLLRYTNLSAVLRQHTAVSDPAWANLLDDDRPIYIVIGDYYIFGEYENNAMEVQRLVREFGINSSLDLEQYLKNNPELADRYTDLSLKYLPVSAATALQRVMTLLSAGGKDPDKVQIVLASEFTPALARSAHVVYLGLLSGMGVLQQLVFDGSQLRIGDSFDELINRQTGQSYVSHQQAIDDARSGYTDYGYFATRTSVDGNQVVIIAGTRDVALQYMADAVTRSHGLDEFAQQAAAKHDYEALCAVRSLEHSSIDGQLQLAHKFSTRWMQMAADAEPIKHRNFAANTPAD